MSNLPRSASQKNAQISRACALLLIFTLFSLACGVSFNHDQAVEETALKISATNPTPTELVQPTATMPVGKTSYPGATAAITASPSKPAVVKEIPRRPLDAAGPWMLFPAVDGLFAANSDGSGLTPLINQGGISLYVQSVAVSPLAGYVAFVTSSNPASPVELTLYLLKLPGGEIEPLTPLTNLDTTPGPNALICDYSFEAGRSISMNNSLAWSPDGTKLAFIGGQNGTTADLYMFDLQSRRIEQLTDGLSQAYGPSWSPDGQYIVHLGASCFGTGAGYSMSGVWATRVEDGETISLYKPDEESLGEEIAGWISEKEVLVYTWSGCPGTDLRAIRLDNRTQRSIYKSCFLDSALSPDGTIAVSVEQQMAVNNRYGLFIYPPGSGQATLIRDTVGYDVRYSETLDNFLVFTTDYMVKRYNRQAQAEGSWNASNPVTISPDGRYWAVTDFDNIKVGLVQNETGKVVLDAPSDYPAWSPDSTSLFFASGKNWDQLDVYVAYAPDFEPLRMLEGRSLMQLPLWVRP